MNAAPFNPQDSTSNLGTMPNPGLTQHQPVQNTDQSNPAGFNVNVDAHYPYDIEEVEDFMKAMEVSKQDGKYVVIDFHAPWCKPCRELGPVFKNLAENYRDKVTCYKVDVDEAEELSELCQISSLPAIHFYENGARIWELVGYDPVGLENKFRELVTLKDLPPKNSVNSNVFISDDF